MLHLGFLVSCISRTELVIIDCFKKAGCYLAYYGSRIVIEVFIGLFDHMFRNFENPSIIPTYKDE